MAKSTKQAAALKPWDLYIAGVLARSIPACEAIQRACERHLRDVERQRTDDFPYWFDVAAAERVIRFVSCLKHSKGEWAGRPLVLGPWQQFVLAVLFGWRRVSDGSRRFRTAYIALPRKNGKSTMLAGVGLYMLVADQEPGAEVYSAATMRDQARIIFDEAVRMRTSSGLAKHIKKFQAALVHEASNSKFVPLASQDQKLDGLNLHAGLVDELHEHPSRDLWDKLATATGSRRQALMFGITTAGSDRKSFCFNQHEYAMKVLEQLIADETFFCFIAQLDEGADWEDEREWAKANPNLGVSVKLETLREEATKAKNDPTQLNAFLRYHLDVWTSAETRAILPAVWKACTGVTGKSVDARQVRELWLEQLAGAPCFAGLDLATTEDLAAEVLYFPQTEENPLPRLLPFFFCPEATIPRRSKHDRVPYDLWARQGFLIPTPGNVIDYHFIRTVLNQHKEKYRILQVGFDPYNATQLVSELMDDGLEMVEVRQGYLSMSAPTKEFKRLVLSAAVAHGANPVLAWMADNLVLSQDPAGNLKPDKEKAREKIDGIVAAIIAVGRASANPELLGGGNAPQIWSLGA